MNSEEVLESRYIELSEQKRETQLSQSTYQCQDTIYTKTLTHLSQLRQERDLLSSAFDSFKQQTLGDINWAMGKIVSVHHKSQQHKIQLEQELSKAKDSHRKMKEQVMQLREMIDEFLKSYNKEIAAKDKEILQLKQLLEKNQVPYTSLNGEPENGLSPMRSMKEKMQQELDPIEEESQHTQSNTTSQIKTLRSEIYPPSSQTKNYQSGESSKLTDQNNVIEIKLFERSKLNPPQTELQNLPTHKKTRQFIDSFRKNIGRGQNPSTGVRGNQSDKNLMGVNQKENQRQQQQPNLANQDLDNVSKSSSTNNLTSLGSTNKINIPLKCQSPKGISFVKKNSKRIFTEQTQGRMSKERLMTEESYNEDRENVQFTPLSMKSKGRVPSGQKLTLSRNLFPSKGANSQYRRTPSTSKQKIKIVSKSHSRHQEEGPKNSKTKLIGSCVYSHRKNVGSVHLGNRNYVNKIKKAVKAALKQYKFKPPAQTQELFYSGNIIGGHRHGEGKLHYLNGGTYEGNFHHNLKQGKGRIVLNGAVIFDGAWDFDRIHGEGHLRTLQLMSESCGQCLRGAVYIGQFASNKFHGLGTLYLPNKQKIVTKFACGIPYGQFTLYTSDNIEFGVWPE